jgi:hypothetical protein
LDKMQLLVHHKDVSGTKNSDGSITYNDPWFAPAVEDDAAWELNRKGAPGKLTFKVVKDSTLQMVEGDEVRAQIDGTDFFFGYIFVKKRNKDATISVTAYDQLRYLKNKDTFQYVGKTATQVIQELAEDFELKIGELDDTAFVIEKRRESNATIFDMMQNALDLTMIHTARLYVLYDHVGRLMLKDIENWKLDLLIDAETAENFSYESSIDKDTYNLVKLTIDNSEQGTHDTFYSPQQNADYQASKTRKQWGVLQLYENLNAKTQQDPQGLADRLLLNHNRVKRTLTIQNVLGDIRVQAGCMVYVNLALGDVGLTAKQVIVENVKHKFSNHQHLMDLTVRGDVITG